MSMNLNWLFAVIFLAVVVLSAWWVVNRQKKRNWLKRASVEDIVNHELFNANMRIVLDELKTAKYGAGHPYNSLSKEGVLNSQNMMELYLHSLQKTLIGYTRRERLFINEVGKTAFLRTMQQMKDKAGM